MFEEAADEIERLRSQPCPYVTGDVTKHCTLTPLTLTDAERAALQYAAASIHDQGLHQMSASMVAYAATLRGLLERTETGEK